METYLTVEHAYQAAKTFDLDERRVIRKVNTPGEAKRLGKKVTMRQDWDLVKLKTMEFLLRQKFSYEHLRDALIATGDAELIEGNTWGDTYWGVCNGVGENHLGKLLMTIRTDINKDIKSYENLVKEHEMKFGTETI
jgi:ribA/ribD-fused uncharacterized protein